MGYIVCIIIGLVVGGIVLGSLLSQLKTVVPNNTASDYIKQGSFNLTQRNDLFLYTKTERQPRPQQQNPNPPAAPHPPASSHH